MMWRFMDEINHRTKIKLQCQCFLNGDAVFVFFKFCVVTVLTVPQCPPLTGTWPALRYEMTVFIPLRGPH